MKFLGSAIAISLCTFVLLLLVTGCVVLLRVIV